MHWLLQFSPLSPFRQCVSVSHLPCSMPSPGWATAIAPWTQSSTRSSWETSNELWGGSCPAVPLSHLGDPRQRCPSLYATQGSPTSPATPRLPWPPTPPTHLPPPLMPSTCSMLSTLRLSCLCFCPIRSTPWIRKMRWVQGWTIDSRDGLAHDQSWFTHH